MSFMDDDSGRAIREVIAGEFDLLLGRRTYEIWASYWPHHDDNPIGQAFNRATKHVVTRTMARLDWNNSQLLGPDTVNELLRLKESSGPALHVWGSSNLLQTLIAADLVDEHRLWVFPLVLGHGRRLFENGVPPHGLKLVGTRNTPMGVQINTYRTKRSDLG
jgi:dihydrofolate reductase